MNNNIFFILMLLLTVSFVRSQESSIKYEVELLKSFKKNPSSNKTSAEILSKASNYISSIIFTLNIADSLASFTQDNLLSSDKDNFYRRTASQIANNYKYFYDFRNEKVYCKKEFAGNTFIVKNNYINNWVISTESKNIGGYKCYKAISNITKLDKTSQAIAWFAPDINFSIGPIGFNGLPGLILELEYGNFKYTATNIYNYSRKIVLPTDGIELSQADFDLYLKEKINLLKNKKL